jgi:thiosulfate dehydrogenase
MLLSFDLGKSVNLSCYFLQKRFNNISNYRVMIMQKILISLLGFFVLASAFLVMKIFNIEPSCYEKRAQVHQYAIMQAHTLYGFNLVDPEQAPPEIRDSVLRGYSIIMNTPFYAPNYAKGQISCTNCHFGGGDNLGGKNNGIALVGVTTNYPSFSKRDNKYITLKDRINNCFQRSMNGNLVPEDSPIMIDLVNYLDWISKEVTVIKDIPWLGLKFLKSEHKPDIEAGKKVYTAYCALCHGKNGEGGGVLAATQGKTVPPLWGPNSFNTGAGMNRVDMFSSFVFYNMPYQDARLTEEQAIDVAGFVTNQPRPEFK